MEKPNVSKFFKDVRMKASKHSPEILTGIGIAGMITTTVLAVKATPKAMDLIEEATYAKEIKRVDEPRKLKPVEVVKVAWKPYVPAAVTGVVSVGCLIGASSVHVRRNAALATAYQLSTTALNEYKEKVVETIGEKKEKAVRDKIAKGKVEKNPVSKSTVLLTNNGTTLCYDSLSGRYFQSDIDRIKQAVNELNYRMSTGMEMHISLNEFYDEIELAQTKIGDDLGWRVDKGLIDVDFSAQLADDNKTPCLVMDFLVPPEYGYNKLY